MSSDVGGAAVTALAKTVKAETSRIPDRLSFLTV